MAIYYLYKEKRQGELGADELMHYGVKGQRWGIRRYQNKDGSLTPLGKKRLQEGATLFPKYKGKTIRDNRDANRKEVAYRIEDEVIRRRREQYDEYIAKHPDFEKPHVDNQTRYSKMIQSKIDKTKREQTYNKELINRFIHDYATATLKDLEMKDTPQTREYVERLIRDNEAWKGLI